MQRRIDDSIIRNQYIHQCVDLLEKLGVVKTTFVEFFSNNIGRVQWQISFLSKLTAYDLQL